MGWLLMALSPSAAPGATEPAEGEQIVVITTNHGRIVAKFFADIAPGHVKNFTDLAASGFYDGVRFHRVIPGFMIQGGDPNSRDMPREYHGSGGPDHRIAAEFSNVPHTRGILSMARTSDPNSAGSQFFVMHNAYPSLDGQYSVFGQVIEGMDVVDTIVELPRDRKDNPLEENPAIMEKVTVTTWPLED